MGLKPFRRLGAHPPQSPDRKRVQEIQLAVGRYQQQTVRFGLLARYFREELGSRDTYGDGQPDAVAHLGAQ